MTARNPILLALLLIAFAGCKKEEAAPSPSGPPMASGPVDVYVVGSEEVGGDLIAKVWKNGQESILTSASNNAIARDVFVAPSGVYVVGYHHETVDNELAFRIDLWINGVPQSWDFDPIYAGISETPGPDWQYHIDDIAQAVFVDGTDVYVLVSRHVLITLSGNTIHDNYCGYYLKNNVRVGLGLGTPKDLFVDNGTVYICGTQGGSALYWENEVEHYLTNGVTGDGYAQAIVVSGGVVHVAGYEYEQPAGQNKAKHWVNGTESVLTTGANQEYGIGLAVNGTDVYVCGHEWTVTGGTKAAAKVWKNGVAQYLTDGTLSKAEGNDIAVHGSDVYVAGREQFVIGAYDHIQLWTNGTVASQNAASLYVDIRTAIAVVPL